MTFPNPVNETSARIVASGVVGMASYALVADQPLMLIPLTYGFAARVVSGPTYSPLGQLATRVVTPRLPIPHRYSPGPPKRLAQGLGLAASVTAGGLLATGRRRAGRGVLAALIGAAGLEAAFGVCLGCKLFAGLMRLGLIDEASCDACHDIWRRYPEGRPASPQ